MNCSTNSLDMVTICWWEWSSGVRIVIDWFSAAFKTIKPLIELCATHTVLPVCLAKQLKCHCKRIAMFATKFHTHTRCFSHTHTLFFKVFHCNFGTNPIKKLVHVLTSAAIARQQAKHSKWQFFCLNLPLGAPSSRSALPLLVGALFQKFIYFLNIPCTFSWSLNEMRESYFEYK